MPRANRHFSAGNIWHITHRCHKQEFLLKFKRDRNCWRKWLFEAKKRYDLTVLNYIVTSNHIHLLVEDCANNSISKSMQLIAGRTAQEFNVRKNRKGAYWEDRYHATAIDTGQYLTQCLVYIDMNMVRAGVVNHPKEWLQSGYHEIQKPPSRYRIIDTDRLCELTSINSLESLQQHHSMWVDEALLQDKNNREAKWTESLAVGRFEFAENFVDSMGLKGLNRSIHLAEDGCIVKEPSKAYNVIF